MLASELSSIKQKTPKVIDSVEVENGRKEAVTAIYDSITVRARQEVSAVFSTGFHYKLKNRSMLIFDIRYIYGLTLPYEFLEDKRALNIDPDNPPRKQPAMHQERNRRFSFSVSYLFSFKN
ncbi:hypothetical protein DC20_04265 [Rufibacter tibetensis]|uniref:Uncharacterized protein n=1 Tax=Rufibacter tibetensis TaxID=512763 RepID=A0A0P0CV95_9BACT|nr:hypothetical protein DC20_04265 [Rufibacter tibetensis]